MTAGAKRPRRSTTALACGSALSLTALVAACASSELPPTMLGSYHRSDIAVVGVEVSAAQLQVAPTGISVTSPEVRASIDIMGKPIVGQRVGGVPSGSALFEKVRCEVKTSCTFTTKNECEGSLTLDGDDIVVVASGPCASWAGKWKRGESKAATSPSTLVPVLPLPPSDVPPSDAPSAAPPPSGSPSAAPSSSGGSFEDAVHCRVRCGDEHATCALRCNAEHACASACSTRYAECRERCPSL